MIYLCRHGQTEFNRQHRFQGQVDSPLTALGQAQARAMGRRLVGLTGADFRLFASPLGRAHHSAQLIAAELGQPPITLDARLMEVGMGVWDGKDDVEIEAGDPGARAGLLPGEWWFHSPDGESYAQFSDRLGAVMAEIAADSAAVKIIVAHGVVSRVIRGQHCGLGKAEILKLTTPQDAIFALLPDAQVEEIPC